jgi:hypothetical protein
MITRALFVRLEAKTDREEKVESFLRSALDVVDMEDGTRSSASTCSPASSTSRRWPRSSSP